jgi:hypothetical protein
VKLERMRDWTIEAIMLDRFVEIVRTKENSARELRIQSAKLQRLLAKNVPGKYQVMAETLGDGPSRKERKRRGQAAARIGEQRKKVRQLVTVFMTEFLNSHAKRPAKRAEVQLAVKGLDNAIAQLTQKIIADTSKIAIQMNKNPFKRLGASPSS